MIQRTLARAPALSPASAPGQDRAIDAASLDSAHRLVAAVRAAAAVHRVTWEAMVPDSFVIDLRMESAEEDAYAAMAAEKAKLRRHICETYGISIRELASLAMA